MCLRNTWMAPKDAWTVVFGNVSDTEHNNLIKEDIIDEPNTALLSAFLMLATFIIAYYLKIFRNGKFLGRTVRNSYYEPSFHHLIFIFIFLFEKISWILLQNYKFRQATFIVGSIFDIFWFLQFLKHMLCF